MLGAWKKRTPWSALQASWPGLDPPWPKAPGLGWPPSWTLAPPSRGSCSKVCGGPHPSPPSLLPVAGVTGSEGQPGPVRAAGPSSLPQPSCSQQCQSGRAGESRWRLQDSSGHSQALRADAARAHLDEQGEHRPAGQLDVLQARADAIGCEQGTRGHSAGHPSPLPQASCPGEPSSMARGRGKTDQTWRPASRQLLGIPRRYLECAQPAGWAGAQGPPRGSRPTEACVSGACTASWVSAGGAHSGRCQGEAPGRSWAGAAASASPSAGRTMVRGPPGQAVLGSLPPAPGLVLTPPLSRAGPHQPAAPGCLGPRHPQHRLQRPLRQLLPALMRNVANDGSRALPASQAPGDLRTTPQVPCRLGTGCARPGSSKATRQADACGPPRQA